MKILILFMALLTLAACGGTKMSPTSVLLKTQDASQFATGDIRTVVFFPADDTHPDETLVTMVEPGGTASFWFVLCGDVRPQIPFGNATVYATIGPVCSTLTGVKQ